MVPARSMGSGRPEPTQSPRSAISIGNRSFQAFRGFGNVDRFFSKLDLRDIKIDPFKTSYPPAAKDHVNVETA